MLSEPGLKHKFNVGYYDLDNKQDLRICKRIKFMSIYRRWESVSGLRWKNDPDSSQYVENKINYLAENSENIQERQDFYLLPLSVMVLPGQSRGTSDDP